MAERKVEVDKHGTPVRVYHRFNKEAWTHGWAVDCDLCNTAGWSVEQRADLTAHIEAMYRGIGKRKAVQALPKASLGAAILRRRAQ